MEEEKNKRGRPCIYTAEGLTEDLLTYIDETEDPYIEEFALKRNVSVDTIYRYKKESTELSDAIKKCHTKQALRTIRRIESGSIPANFGIFKLKQKAYGAWTDKQQIEQAINQKISFDFDLSEDDE